MTNIEKIIRGFASLFTILIGQAAYEDSKSNSPLWSVVGAAIVGLISLVLIVIGFVAYVIK